MSFLQLATVDGRRVDPAPERAPGPPISAETMRFLCEMRSLHNHLYAATKATALLVADGAGGAAGSSTVAEGLALKVTKDLGLAIEANLEAQRLVPHLIGLVIVEAGSE